MASPINRKTIQQPQVRRYGASLGLIGLALLLSRYVTPSGASSPLVLLGATAAVAYFGGRWPAILATITAAVVNGVGIGVVDSPRLGVESTMIILLGLLLAFRIPSQSDEPVDAAPPLQGEATVTRVGETTSVIVSQAEFEPLQSGSTAPPSHGTSSDIEDVDSLVKDAGSSHTLLIVHGNAVLRLALRSTLAGLGYQVRDVANVSYAMSMLASQEFDGILLDIGRVDDSALSAVERLRGATNKDCALIVTANAENDDDRELLQAAGADRVLRKPIDTTGVAAELQSLVASPSDVGHSRVGFGASP